MFPEQGLCSPSSPSNVSMNSTLPCKHGPTFAAAPGAVTAAPRERHLCHLIPSGRSSGASVSTPAPGHQHTGQREPRGGHRPGKQLAHEDSQSVLAPWQTPSQNKTLLSPCTPEPPKKRKSPAAAGSPVRAAASPLGAQRLDHCGEEPPILGGDLCDVLRAADVRVLHRLGEGSTSRAVAEGAGEVAAVACRHGSSGPLCPGPGTRETCRTAPQSELGTLECPTPHHPSALLTLAAPQGPNRHAFCESSVPFNRLCEAALP